jgi:hypothetical protein
MYRPTNKSQVNTWDHSSATKLGYVLVMWKNACCGSPVGSNTSLNSANGAVVASDPPVTMDDTTMKKWIREHINGTSKPPMIRLVKGWFGRAIIKNQNGCGKNVAMVNAVCIGSGEIITTAAATWEPEVVIDNDSSCCKWSTAIPNKDDDVDRNDSNCGPNNAATCSCCGFINIIIIGCTIYKRGMVFLCRCCWKLAVFGNKYFLVVVVGKGKDDTTRSTDTSHVGVVGEDTSHRWHNLLLRFATARNNHHNNAPNDDDNNDDGGDDSVIATVGPPINRHRDPCFLRGGCGKDSNGGGGGSR